MYSRPPEIVRFSITFIVEKNYQYIQQKEKNYQYYASGAYNACSIVDMSRRILSILIKNCFLNLFFSTPLNLWLISKVIIGY